MYTRPAPAARRVDRDASSPKREPVRDANLAALQGRPQLRRDRRAVRPPLRGASRRRSRPAPTATSSATRRSRYGLIAGGAPGEAAAASTPATRSRRRRTSSTSCRSYKNFGVPHACRPRTRSPRRRSPSARRSPATLAVDGHERARARPQGRGDRPGHQPRAADGHRRRAARRPVDRHADQDRADRPAAGDVRPPRRVAAADRRRQVAVALLRRGVRGVPARGQVPHAGDPAHRRLPRQRRRAVAAARRVDDLPGHLGRRSRPRPNHTGADGEPDFWPYLRDPDDAGRDRGRSRARPGCSTASAASRSRTAPATSATSPRTTSAWSTCARRRSTASPTTSPASSSTTRTAPSVLVLGWGSTWAAITAGVRRVRARGERGRPGAPRRTSTRSRPTSATCSPGTRKVLCPEMNLGQLAGAGARPVPRRRARATRKVTGRARSAPREMEKRILEVIDDEHQRHTATNGNGNGDRRATPVTLTRKDFESDQEVRWCPGCGDYGILAAIQLDAARARHRAAGHGVRLRHRLRGAPAVLHEHLRGALDPRPCAGDRHRRGDDPSGPVACG